MLSTLEKSPIHGTDLHVTSCRNQQLLSLYKVLHSMNYEASYLLGLIIETYRVLCRS